MAAAGVVPSGVAVSGLRADFTGGFAGVVGCGRLPFIRACTAANTFAASSLSGPTNFGGCVACDRFPVPELFECGFREIEFHANFVFSRFPGLISRFPAQISRSPGGPAVGDFEGFRCRNRQFYEVLGGPLLNFSVFVELPGASQGIFIKLPTIVYEILPK